MNYGTLIDNTPHPAPRAFSCKPLASAFQPGLIPLSR